MSDAHSPSSESPLAKLLNSILLLGAPALLLAMLGLTGFFFVAGMGDTAAERAEDAAAVAAAAPAPAPGGAPSAAPEVTAAPAPAKAGGKPEGVTDEFWNLGKSSYMTCGACHGPDGQGLQAGPAKMAPSMTASEMLLGDPDKSILVVLKGIQKENMDFLGIMAALGAGLNDEQIAAVLTYCRNSFGNSAPAVTTEQVAAARAKYASVNAPAGVKRSEIDSIVGGAN
jgi:mono/diheme cytochrome c family protein